jgi:hypothetical protein
VSQASYTQLAVWLQRYEPALFQTLLAKSRKLSALGDLYRGPFFTDRARHSFGDYADYFSDAASIVDYSSSAVGDIGDVLDDDDFISGSLESELEEPSISEGVAAETANASDLPIASNVSDAPLPSDVTNPLDIQGDASSIPTMPTAAVNSAASTVGQTLSSNAGLLVATLNAANTILSANAAANLVAAQAARAAAGLAPANVSYVADGSGNLVPVLNTGSGQLPLTAAGVDALAPATFLQNYGLYIMLGLAGLVLAMEK